MLARKVLVTTGLALALLVGALGTTAAQDTPTTPAVPCDGPHMMDMAGESDMAAIHAQIHGSSDVDDHHIGLYWCPAGSDVHMGPRHGADMDQPHMGMDGQGHMGMHRSNPTGAGTMPIHGVDDHDGYHHDHPADGVCW